jgi:hypothetical protein
MKALQLLILKYKYTLAILGVLVVAACARLFHLTQIPLANDELSALHRLQFPSFKALITHGVMPDGHPALVQVFLYYYTKLVGTSSSLIKLPFIVCGVASVWVAYVLFTRENSRRVGLMVALSMATTQFFIMHSQQARPYAMGLLFVLLLALYLHKLALKTNLAHYAATVFFMLLAASTHYIALLTAGCLVLAWVWVDVKRLPKAILITASVMLLYIPQLAVFFQQLKVGGVGSWLGKPQLNFIYQFFKYTQHHYAPLLLVTFVLGWASVIFLAVGKFTKQQLYPLLVFGLTFVVAFLYSVYRNPVLQFPVLLFAWPFMLAFLVSAVNYLPRVVYVFLVGLMMGLQLYSLVFTRKHYQVFYHQSYSQTVRQLVEHAPANTPLLLNGNQPYYFDYYFRLNHYTPNLVHTRIDSLTIPQYQAMLQNTASDTIVVGHGFDLSSLYFEWAKVYYPNVIFHQQQAFNELYVLAKSPNKLPATNSVFDTLTPEKLYSKNVQLTCVQAALQRIRLVAQAHFAPSSLPNQSVLVIKVFDANERMIAESAQRYFNNAKQIAIASLDVAPTPQTQTLNVQAFVLNEKQQQLIIQNLTLTTQPGNSLIYSTVEAIPDRE